MATSTGTSLSLKSFTDQFISFAVANAGFSDSGTVAMTVTGGDVDAHSVSKGGVTWVFTTGQTSEFVDGNGGNYLESRMCYASPIAASAWSTSNPIGQPGMSRFSTYVSGLTFSSPHWFFSDGVACHAVLEIFPNVFSHLSFGSADKKGVYDGGEYLTGTDLRAWNVTANSYIFSSGVNQYPWSEHYLGGYFRNSRGGNDEDDFAPFGNSSNGISGGNPQQAKGVVHPDNYNTTPGDGSGFVGSLFTCSPNATNLRSILIPIYIRARDLSSAPIQYHIVGVPAGVRLVNMKELDPKAIVDNDWQVFPLGQKLGDPSVAATSVNMGLAYDTSL